MGTNILIVDDEEFIRKGLIARLEYLDFHFEHIYEAEDGASALTCLDKNRIDIIITDIRMSTVDGLTLIRQAKERRSNIQIAILSGYAEFEYAEQAIGLGVVSYLLKPISNDQLKKCIIKMLLNLKQIDINRTSRKRANRILGENKQYTLEKAVNEMLHMSQWKEASKVILSNPQLAQLLSNSKEILLASICIDMKTYANISSKYKNINLVRFIINNIFEEIMTQDAIPYIFTNSLIDSSQMYLLLYGDSKETLRQQAEYYLGMLTQNLLDSFGILLTVGVGCIGEEVYQKTLREASEAFFQRVIFGGGRLFFYDDIKKIKVDKIPESDLHLLELYIQRHDIRKIEGIIERLLSYEKVAKYNTKYIRVLWVRIVNIILQSQDRDIECSLDQLQYMMEQFETIAQQKSLGEIKSYLYEMILKAIQDEANLDIDARNKIRIAVHYINEHYNQDISINDLASKFYMSPNYFSTIFKREIGKSATNYIKDIRIDQAKRYLTHSKKSVVEISKDVGYEDSQYFSKIFKRATGMTPLFYRKSAQINYRGNDH